MSLFRKIKLWWDAHRPRPLSELLAVECDDASVRVRVIDRLDPAFNQEFQWADVVRICFKDGGVSQSDVVFIELRGREKPAIILT